MLHREPHRRRMDARVRASRRTSTRPIPTTWSASTRRPTRARRWQRLPPPRRPSPAWRGEHAAAARRMRWTRSAPRSWPARTSSGGCCRARRARRCPRASARPRARARSSSSSRAQALSLAGDLRALGPAGHRRSRSPASPLGVVGLITPWNFPIAIPAWKIAPALAFGNCVVFKPADLVPGSAWALAEIIGRAGLPAGRVQPGHGPRTRWSARR